MKFLLSLFTALTISLTPVYAECTQPVSEFKAAVAEAQKANPDVTIRKLTDSEVASVREKSPPPVEFDEIYLLSTGPTGNAEIVLFKDGCMVTKSAVLPTQMLIKLLGIATEANGS